MLLEARQIVEISTGRDMKLSHKGMGINEADWQAFLGQLNATSDTFQVCSAETRGGADLRRKYRSPARFSFRAEKNAQRWKSRPE